MERPCLSLGYPTKPDPWGTSDSTATDVDFSPLITKAFVLFVEKLLIQEFPLPPPNPVVV